MTTPTKGDYKRGFQKGITKWDSNEDYGELPQLS
jgi:hypothetical protein